MAACRDGEVHVRWREFVAFRTIAPTRVAKDGLFTDQSTLILWVLAAVAGVWACSSDEQHLSLSFDDSKANKAVSVIDDFTGSGWQLDVRLPGQVDDPEVGGP